MKVKSSIFFIIAITLLFSCDKKRVYDDYISFDNAWHRDSTLVFKLPELDSTKRYDLFINLRDNNDYPFSNIFLIVALEMQNGFTKVDTLEYQMTNPDGTLLGEGFSDIKESKLVYKENVKFRGKYKVSIKQAVRQIGEIPGVEDLKGITEVGFRIEEIEQ